MDYMELASELLKAEANMLQVPTIHLMQKMVRGELFVLNYLLTHENEVHPKELSTKMSVSTARVATVLNFLDQKGLIVRHPDPYDKRQVVVELTEEGRKAIDHYRDKTLPAVGDLLEKLGPEDAEAFVRIKKKIYQLYKDRR